MVQTHLMDRCHGAENSSEKNSILKNEIHSKFFIVQPPIIPKVDHPGDTQNFELFDDEFLQAPECTQEEYDLFHKF